jgi:hypothetical protein
VIPEHGQNLLEGLCAKVPGVGRFLDDIAQEYGGRISDGRRGPCGLGSLQGHSPLGPPHRRFRLGLQATPSMPMFAILLQDILPAILEVGDSSRETMDKIVSAIRNRGHRFQLCEFPFKRPSRRGIGYECRQNLHTFSKERIFSLFGRNPDA